MSETHKSYKELFNHECDFKVEYIFYSFKDGGRKNVPHQGIRSDFWYISDKHDDNNTHYMIYPEFENENGELIESGPVPKSGIARMWILNPKWRKYHQERISLDTIGYFHEGSTRTAECRIVQMVGLNRNPTE